MTTIARPCSLCLEDLSAEDPDRRFLRCVALPGRQPGLRLHTDGTVGWQTSDAVSCELLVSRDQRLLLFRPSGAPPVEVHRAGRCLRVPHDKPAVLIDDDEVRVSGRRFRVHVHGEATAVSAPSYLVGRVLAQGRAAASVMALGAAVLGCNRPPAVDASPSPVRIGAVESAIPSAEPSTPSIVAAPPASEVPLDAGAEEDATVPDAEPPAAPTSLPDAQPHKAPGSKPPIELRDMPPFAD